MFKFGNWNSDFNVIDYHIPNIYRFLPCIISMYIFLTVIILDMHSGDLFRYIVCIKIPIGWTTVLEGKTSRALNKSSVGALYEGTWVYST